MMKRAFVTNAATPSAAAASTQSALPALPAGEADGASGSIDFSGVMKSINLGGVSEGGSGGGGVDLSSVTEKLPSLPDIDTITGSAGVVSSAMISSAV